MKIRRYIMVSGFAWLALHAHAQDLDLQDASASVSPARILGPIADGTTGEDDPDLPGFKVRSRDILSTRTQVEAGSTITVHEIKPVALAELSETLNEDRADTALTDENSTTEEISDTTGPFILSAIVYRFANGTPPRSYVRYWPDGAKEPVHLWSSADFSLIAGGIQSFVDSKGITHGLMMAWSETELTQLDEVQLEGDEGILIEKIPNLAAGSAAFQPIGKGASEEVLLPIRSLHDLYNSNLEALKQAHRAREEAAQRKEAESKTEQSTPRNITLHYWRNETPAVQEDQGGAQ